MAEDQKQEELDARLLAQMLEDFLEMSGCVIVGPAARVAKALALASTEEIDGALLDINLAGQEAYGVADKLSARNIPYAFTTGYQLKNVREAYRGRPLLRKPFSDKDLDRTLRALATNI